MAAGASRDGPQLLFRHHNQHTTPFWDLQCSMTSLSTLGSGYCCVDCDCKFSNIEVANQVCQNQSKTQSKLRAAQVLFKLVFQTPWTPPWHFLNSECALNFCLWIKSWYHRLRLEQMYSKPILILAWQKSWYWARRSIMMLQKPVISTNTILLSPEFCRTKSVKKSEIVHFRTWDFHICKAGVNVATYKSSTPNSSSLQTSCVKKKKKKTQV
jgi:hypothetical protein